MNYLRIYWVSNKGVELFYTFFNVYCIIFSSNEFPTKLISPSLSDSPLFALLPPTNHPSKLLFLPLIATVDLSTEQSFIVIPFWTDSPTIPPANG